MWNFLKRCLSVMTLQGHTILDQLETVELRCKKVMLSLDKQIDDLYKAAEDAETGRNKYEQEVISTNKQLSAMENVFIKAGSIGNLEDQESANAEICRLESKLEIYVEAFESCDQESKGLQQTLVSLKQNREKIASQLELAKIRYDVAKSQQNFYKGSSGYIAIEKEIKTINDIVVDTDSRAKAIGTVQKNTESKSKTLTQVYNASSVSVSDRLAAIESKRHQAATLVK